MHPRYPRTGRSGCRRGANRFLRSLLAAAALVGLLSRETPASSSGVDTARVHQLYLGGDFDEAIALLEANLKAAGPYRHEDSVFIFKHLGVMYAAQYDTRERGKYFMHMLLQVEPTAKILDMYASDMIYMIFKNIQEEYEQNRMQLAARYPDRNGGPDAASGRDAGKPAESARPSHGPDRKVWLWTGAAVAAVAAGVGAFYLIASGPEPEVRAHDVSP